MMIRKVKQILTTKKRWVWIVSGLVVFTAAVASLLPALARLTPGQLENPTAMVSRGTITETVQATGIIEAAPSARLSWESGGIISDFDVKVGDRVEKGEILLTLEPNSISADILQTQISLLEAQAELDKLLSADTDYQAVLKEMTYQEETLLHKYNARHVWYSRDVTDQRIEAVRANYEKVRGEVWQLEADYEKVRKLEKDNPQRIQAYDALQTGILKRDSLLRALSQIMGTPYNYLAETDFIAYDQQKALVAETRAAFERYVDYSEEISAARAKVQQLQNTIDQAMIIAPFTGTVTAINAVTDEQVSTGDIALQLDDLSNMAVTINISQIDINTIKPGQAAELTFYAIANSSYSGTVLEISEAGSSSDNTFKVSVGLDEPDEQVKPGFTAAVNIIANQVNDALLVPNSVIQLDDNGKLFVMVEEKPGNYSTVLIKTGARSDAFSELIGSILKEGDILAIGQTENSIIAHSSEAMMFAARSARSGN